MLLAMTATARADDFEGSLIPTVMDRPWSFTFALGAETLRATSGQNSHAHLLGGAEFALRYRLAPELELGLAADGGGTASVARVGFYVDVRYRISAETPWSPVVLLQLGGAMADTGFDEEHARDLRPSMRIGFALDRRYRSWGFALAFHGFVVGSNGDIEYRPFSDYDARNVARGFVAGASLSLQAIYYWGAQPRAPQFGSGRPRN